ncbi:hypothetical protein RD792_015957 [Penstemon davidsonii]|uniref:TIR domain-containing protein n=1 Tax=Penstemon davidsonii TaxID=160366 RepID=A0ABR0CIK1_9LAMI|nr:hypothetical protein RD792_015957 [Penstemon davidsonii]
MAARESHESSSMSKFSYHVYMSFRYKDIGRTFADHLYTDLLNGGFRTFRKEDELEEGHQNLSNTIQASRIGIVIFSENYASSEWCLDELVSILERWRSVNLSILPIFYNMDPSDVRKQKGSFEEPFTRYEDRDKTLTGERKNKWIEKVKQWKIALKEIADLGGMVSQNQADGYESKFIKEIVKEVGRKLSRTVLDVALYPIGLDSRIKEIDSWLQDGSAEVGILTISGMGGIGKTTIAKTAYNLNFDKFSGSSFLADVRKASEHHNGLVRLQRQLLSNILGKRVEKIHNLDSGIIKIQEAVCCRKVLLVLDDVDDIDQLNSVLAMKDWFYPGSKIIITTRNEHLLRSDISCKNYRVKIFDRKESLQLFSLHAFKQDHPPDNYIDLSRRVVIKCGGIPLALKVLGSSLCERGIDIWESALKKLEAIPDHEILKKLRISYDCLQDDHDQNMFLDIVCFFVGKKKQFAVTILDGCGFYSVVGIQNLIERCLITVENDGKLKIHQLILDMGREIIRHESPWLPGKRSRVWRHKDSYNVLMEYTGTGRIEGLVLDMQMLKDFKSNTTSFQEFRFDAFSRMKKLRILKLSYAHVLGSYDDFPEEVKWIYWNGFQLKSIPTDFPLESLVALEMKRTRLEQVWKGIKYLEFLKILDLSHSHGLKTTPDFIGLPNLESLILKDCVKLVYLHESVVYLDVLTFLNLRDCRNLKKFPKKFGNLKSLEKLIISGCTELITSVSELGKLESLTVLHADNVTLGQPLSANNLITPWRSFLKSWFSTPGNYPESVRFSLASLSHSLLNISLSNCNLHDESISVDLSSLSSLQFLNLSENPFYGLPQSIINLSTLQDLWLDACKNLKILPQLPSSITKLKAIDCTSLESIMNLPNLLDSLYLDVDGCEKLSEVQGLFKLEPIENFSEELINILGDFNLNSIQELEVELYNKMSHTKKRLSVQGLFEFDILSTYLPGSEVSNSFNYVTKGSLVLSFNISPAPKTKIIGLNICVVYARSSERRFRLWGESSHSGSWYTFYIKVVNVTKGLKWVYGPTFIGIPGPKEDMTYLSHWKLGNELEIGDEVNVSVVGWGLTFQMKLLGVNLVYCEKQEEIKSDFESYMLPSYQVGGMAYFFSHPEYFASKNRSDNNSVLRSILVENLFEDRVETAGSSNLDEEESDFDFDDDEYADEEELEEILQWTSD